MARRIAARLKFTYFAAAKPSLFLQNHQSKNTQQYNRSFRGIISEMLLEYSHMKISVNTGNIFRFISKSIVLYNKIVRTRTQHKKIMLFDHEYRVYYATISSAGCPGSNKQQHSIPSLLSHTDAFT